MDIVLAIAIPLALSVLTPLVVGASADRIARARSKERKQRALERVEDNPMCKPGARINELWMDTGGGLSKLPGEWGICKIRRGYLSIERTDDRGQMNFTLEEWEGFHPIYDSPDTVKLKAASIPKPVKPKPQAPKQKTQAKPLRSKEAQNRAIPD